MAAAGNPAAPFPLMAPKHKMPATHQPLNPKCVGGLISTSPTKAFLKLEEYLAQKSHGGKHLQAVWAASTNMYSHPKTPKPPQLYCTHSASLFYNVCQCTDVPNLWPHCAYHAYLRQIQQNLWRSLQVSSRVICEATLSSRKP